MQRDPDILYDDRHIIGKWLGSSGAPVHADARHSREAQPPYTPELRAEHDPLRTIAEN